MTLAAPRPRVSSPKAILSGYSQQRDEPLRLFVEMFNPLSLRTRLASRLGFANIAAYDIREGFMLKVFLSVLLSAALISVSTVNASAQETAQPGVPTPPAVTAEPQSMPMEQPAGGDLAEVLTDDDEVRSEKPAKQKSPSEETLQLYIDALNLLFGLDGVAKDPAKGAVMMKRAAELGGYPPAYRRWGDLLAAGDVVPKDEKASTEWYFMAAETGDAEAMRKYALALLDGIGTEVDLPASHDWFLKAAEAGDISAMQNVGYNFKRGIGTAKDAEKSLRWSLRAAELGDKYAMFDVGLSYMSRSGTEEDHRKSVAWLRKSADLGFPRAMGMLGAMLGGSGNGVSDPKQAIFWLQKAADAGDCFGMNQLAHRINNGYDSIEKNSALAQEMYAVVERAGGEFSMRYCKMPG